MSCSNQTFDFQELPDEVKLEIFTFLNQSTLLVCSEVCTEWKALADDDALWIEHCRNKWADKQNHSLTHIREKRLRAPGRSWKRLYYEAEKDARRSFINKDELCSHKWKFTFQGFHWRSAMMYPVFREDYKFIMDDSVLDWRFTGDSRVQVEEYPPLTASRTADWGWRMENHYVVFTSIPDYATARTRQKEAAVAAMGAATAAVIAQS